jgi:hypothetical protein
VTIISGGIVKNGDDLGLVTVAFGTAQARILGTRTTASQGVLLDVIVPPDAAGCRDVTIALANGKKATVLRFVVIPVITDVDPREAKPGDSISIVADGVHGLGTGFPDCRSRSTTSRRRYPAATTLQGASALGVTVPDGASGGPGEIVLRTLRQGPPERFDFTVLVRIRSLDPPAQKVGETVKEVVDAVVDLSTTTVTVNGIDVTATRDPSSPGATGGTLAFKVPETPAGKTKVVVTSDGREAEADFEVIAADTP